jgi:hypothetical protein
MRTHGAGPRAGPATENMPVCRALRFLPGAWLNEEGKAQRQIVAQRLTGPALTDKLPGSGYLAIKRYLPLQTREDTAAPSQWRASCAA